MLAQWPTLSRNLERAGESLVEVSPEVEHALARGHPVVALESAVITHGLPAPYNGQVALEMEREVRAAGAIPATIALWEGRMVVGLDGARIQELARMAADEAQRRRLGGRADWRWSTRSDYALYKVSVRDLGPLLARRDPPPAFGGTTVAATLAIAALVGIRFFATGGIGGVHHDPPYDISADLPQLAFSPVMTVCAGAKAILNLDATLEYLETWGVPVVGYRTAVFPAFYSPDSPWPVRHQVTSPQQAACLARAHWAIGRPSAVLLVVPPPPSQALSYAYVRQLIEHALAELQEHNRGKPLAEQIRGAAVTPYLLERLSALSDERTLQANLALLRNNARVAAQVARAWADLAHTDCG